MDTTNTKHLKFAIFGVGGTGGVIGGGGEVRAAREERHISTSNRAR